MLKSLNVTKMPKAQFFLEFALANRIESKDMSVKHIASIDDESSPGVFSVSIYPFFYCNARL